MTFGSSEPRPKPGGPELPERFARVAERVVAVEERLLRLQQLAAEQGPVPRRLETSTEPDPA